jgi:hypothetical protein
MRNVALLSARSALIALVTPEVLSVPEVLSAHKAPEEAATFFGTAEIFQVPEARPRQTLPDEVMIHQQ